MNYKNVQTCDLTHEVVVGPGAHGASHDLNLNEGKVKRKGLRTLGQDPMAQWANMFEKASGIKSPGDPLSDETEANQIIIDTLPQQNSGEKQALFSLDIDTNEGGGEEELQFENPVDEDAMSVIYIEGRGDLIKQVDEERKEIGALNIEEVIPLNSAELTENMNPESHSSVSFWVRQNILRLGEEFGVHFQGCEELAEELFMKLDWKR